MVYYGELGKKMEIFWDKISSTGCKWSSLNAPRSETPVSHSLFGSVPNPKKSVVHARKMMLNVVRVIPLCIDVSNGSGTGLSTLGDVYFAPVILLYHYALQ